MKGNEQERNTPPTTPRRRCGLGRFVLACWLATTCLAHADDWWIKSRTDAQWTNRPLDEIKAAAQSGEPAAQFHYARAFFFGTSGGADLSESLRWTKRAAEQGLADAQFMVARFLFSGTATPSDGEEGLAWASRAANQGHADALALVADALTYGNGTNRQPAKAKELFLKAIDLGSIEALDWLGHFYWSGEGGTARTTNYVEALRYFERAASNGLSHPVSHLVDFYTTGLGTPPDSEKVLFWVRKAVDQKDSAMLEKLAGLYSGGTAEPRGPSDTPVELLRRAAGQRAAGFERFGARNSSLRTLYSLTTDASELCTRYRYGLGTSPDFVATAQWMWVLKRASVWESELRPPRDPAAAKPLHTFDQIAQGKLAPASANDRLMSEAVALVHRALDQCEANACRQIAEMYRAGSPLTPQAPVPAWAWLNRATELKDATAKTPLSEVESILTPEQLSSARNRYLPKCSAQQ